MTSRSTREGNRGSRRPTMGGAAVYRIQVRGRLDAAWSQRFGGLNITEIRTPDGEVETVLVGRLTDQADLSGVLAALYESHLPVVAAECLDGEPEEVGQSDENDV